MITASDTPQTVDEVSKALTVVDNQEIEERDEIGDFRIAARCARITRAATRWSRLSHFDQNARSPE